MPREVMPGLQAMEFVTNQGRRLEFTSSLLSWNDQHGSTIVEHLILKRDGAIHQNQGAKPSEYSFRCVYMDPGARQKYRQLRDALEEEPLGKLIHPTFGSRSAVCKDISVEETPESATNEIRFTLKFSETGLRTEPLASASSIASGALSRAESLVAAGPASFVAAATQLRGAVQVFAGQVVSTTADLAEFERSLEVVREQALSASAVARAQNRYEQGAESLMIYALCLDARLALTASVPANVERIISSDQSLARFVAKEYGGRLARSMSAQIRLLNRIPNPALLPAGSRLRIPDPQAVIRGSR